MSIQENVQEFMNRLQNSNTRLIAVSKTQPEDAIMEAYNAGLRRFGENKVQEMVAKWEKLPHDIEWHLIGHLQTNKVKYIAPFVTTIQSVDSLKLLLEINKHAEKWNRLINCMLQIRIAREDTKYGLSCREAHDLLMEVESNPLSHVRIVGVMGIATNTDNQEQLQQEFRALKQCFLELRETFYPADDDVFVEISMGMSSDWQLALQEGSTLIRVGSAIFGARDYSK